MSVDNVGNMPVGDIDALNEKAKKLEQYLERRKKKEQDLQAVANNVSLLVTDDDYLRSQFDANLKALEEYFPDVYHFFKDYQPSRYVVDIHEGFPNVFDTQTNDYLYPFPPYLMALEQIQRFKLKPTSTRAMFDPDEKNQANFLHSDYMNKFIDIWSQQLAEKGGKQGELPKKVSNALIFGVGAGHHLELLVSQHEIDNLFIIEPELDVFYASLFICNWRYLLDSISDEGRVHLSLGPQDESFFQDLLQRTMVNGRYEAMKSFGMVHYRTPAIDELAQEYKDRFYELIQGWGFFDDAVMSISHMMSSIKAGVPVIKKRELANHDLKETPIFIVGNGPSLDGLIDTIRAHQDEAIIISCGSAFSALYEYGIVPDFHCEQERTFPIAEKMEYYCPPDILRKVIFGGPSTLHPAAYEKFDLAFMAPKGAEASVHLLETSETAKTLFERHTHINPTVANTALSLMIGLGFNNFYFMGVDLGHKAEGHHHSTKSMYYDDTGEDLDLYRNDKQLNREIRGNFSENIVTERFFYTSAQMIERLIAKTEGINCFNLSDGIYLKGATPLYKENLTKVCQFNTLENKADKLKALVQEHVHYDTEEALYTSLKDQLDYNGFERVCEQLIDMINEPRTSFAECLKLLKSIFYFITDDETCPRYYHYLLLEGSIMHIQAVMVNILYEGLTEKESVDKFAEAAEYYVEFLAFLPGYYRENALVPHYCETDWFEPLTKK